MEDHQLGFFRTAQNRAGVRLAGYGQVHFCLPGHFLPQGRCLPQNTAQIKTAAGRHRVLFQRHQVHHLAQGALQPGGLQLHIGQRLPGGRVAALPQVHLQIFPVLVHEPNRMKADRLKLPARELHALRLLLWCLAHPIASCLCVSIRIPG